MTNSDNRKNIDKNKLYIGIFTLIIVIVLIIIFASKGKNPSNNTSDNSNATNAVATIAINAESGKQDATIKKDINIPSREIDFSKSMKKIMKSEAKKDDTLDLDDNYEPAKSDDGYTYLMYNFNNVNAPKFFGTQVATSDDNAMLTYVFYKEKLIEVRIQYGSVGNAAYDSIIQNITSLYGDSTYSRSYSNGSQEAWWKTKKVTLDVIYQDSQVVVYYRKNK